SIFCDGSCNCPSKTSCQRFDDEFRNPVSKFYHSPRLYSIFIESSYHICRFPNPGTISISFSLNGNTVTASAGISTSFGWNCVASVFGQCLVAVPYEKISLNAGVPGVVNLIMSSQVFVGASASYTLSQPAVGPDPLDWGL